MKRRQKEELLQSKDVAIRLRAAWKDRLPNKLTQVRTQQKARNLFTQLSIMGTLEELEGRLIQIE